MSAFVTFPSAPKKYSQRDQIEVRRIIEAALRDIEIRIRALENPPA
jgi:hypothetical protein